MTKNENKICIACGMSIPEIAKKCLHCHSWQSKITSAQSNKIISYFFIIAVVLLFGGIIFDIYYNEIYRDNIPFSKYKDQFEVVDSKMYFNEDCSQSYISSIGHIKNNTDLTWEDLTIEVQFLNASNDLIDTITDTNYSLVVPPMSSITYRVRNKADKPKDQYSSQKVVVRWAKIDD